MVGLEDRTDSSSVRAETASLRRNDVSQVGLEDSTDSPSVRAESNLTEVQCCLTGAEHGLLGSRGPVHVYWSHRVLHVWDDCQGPDYIQSPSGARIHTSLN